jgi:hypothetical protein
MKSILLPSTSTAVVWWILTMIDAGEKAAKLSARW